MRIGVTGATGFLGRYIVNRLLAGGHDCRCWYREGSDRGGFDESRGRIEWIAGELNEPAANAALVDGVDAVVHGALYRSSVASFRNSIADIVRFTEVNVLGSLRLMEAATQAGVGRFVFISSCAVHEVIVPGRPLDETHPMWPMHHYGAHKAAIEEFVYSYGYGENQNMCALRPCGIYGLARPLAETKWYDLVQRVKRGEPIDSAKGGKEVHASDVAKAVEILLHADGTKGQSYNCCDMYISEEQVARIAQRLTGSSSTISDTNRGPKNQIDTTRLRSLGMQFGGETLLEETIARMIEETSKDRKVEKSK